VHDKQVPRGRQEHDPAASAHDDAADHRAVCPTDRPDDSAAAHKHAGTDRRASGHCPDDAARGGDKQDPVLVGDNDASH
jgi:hypothetical protein